MTHAVPPEPAGEAIRRQREPERPPAADGEVPPFLGRSCGWITATREDLIAPVGADWEVDTDP